MRIPTAMAIVVAAAAIGTSCSRQSPGSLEASAEALGAGELSSIEYSGTGRWYQFGQAPSPTLPWPEFEVSSFTATVDYGTPAARVQMTRRQVVDPGRERPAPVEQRPDQYVSGTAAWNLATPAGAAAGTPPNPTPQPAARDERTLEIWTTPHGFIKAALANNASSTPAEGGGSEVTFTADGRAYTGWIDAQSDLVRVHTTLDNPILGDTPVEFTYSEYRDFSGVRFPSRIVRTQGGHPVLDLTISSVTPNPDVDIAAPTEVTNAAVPAVTATAERLANGVYYIKGGSHHSIAIDQRDHIIVVEAPLNEERSLAVIQAVKETIPGKPIRYIVNTHHHFDHSGGLRTYVDEGATVVTHEVNRPYYEEAWAAPRTLNPDRLAQSGKSPMFETFSDRLVLTDGQRPVEVHHIAGSGHHDGFAMVYLPRERILIEADAYTPPAQGAPPPATPNPFWVNLLDNVQRLKLNVQQVAALHGDRVVTLAELRAAAGQAPRSAN